MDNGYYDDYGYDYDESDYRSRISKDKVELDYILDEGTTLRHWLDPHNKLLNYQDCEAGSSQVCWTKASNQFKPFESEYEGFMGNYGNTMDYWYHRSAIVLWQNQDNYAMRFKIDLENVLKEIIHLAKTKTQQSQSQVQQIMNELLPYWSDCQRNCKPLWIFELALVVHDKNLAHRLLKDLGLAVLNAKTAHLLLTLNQTYGESWCLALLEQWTSDNHLLARCEKINQVIPHLCASSKNKKNALADWLINYEFIQVKTIVQFDKEDNYKLLDSTERIKEIFELLKACIIARNQSLYGQIVSYVIENIDLYSVINVSKILPDLRKNLLKFGLDHWQFSKLFNHVFKKLKQEQAVGLHSADNWSITEKWSCTCEDCKVLVQFLRSTAEITKVWPLNKDRRRHIHQIIDALNMPVTHDTKRRCSPCQLILTKTRALHSRAKQRFTKIGEEINKLTKIC